MNRSTFLRPSAPPARRGRETETTIYRQRRAAPLPPSGSGRSGWTAARGATSGSTVARLLALIAIACGLSFGVGCDTGGTPRAQADARFAPGAFPPTLSDVDYHRNAWTRKDCLTCHEKGVDNAPKTEHRSLPADAKLAKCRSCHVFIPGSPPRQ